MRAFVPLFVSQPTAGGTICLAEFGSTEPNSGLGVTSAETAAKVPGGFAFDRRSRETRSSSKPLTERGVIEPKSIAREALFGNRWSQQISPKGNLACRLSEGKHSFTMPAAEVMVANLYATPWSGTGLGLSIAYSIARKHGETFTLENAEGGDALAKIGLLFVANA